MADSIIPGTPDASVKGLKDTLHAQQDLLQQLYTELDVEREAAATATDESLSMMLRLQGEKAAVEMEASQYKRIAEEKIGHAEETLATFRDLIYQKEMQIASLEFQVQAYKFKLISLGCTDVGECDPNFPENMFLRKSGQSVGDATMRARLRRGCSLPPTFSKDGEDPPTDGEDPPTDGEEDPPTDGEESEVCVQMVPGTKALDLHHAKSGGDFTCYWEQIKKLDEQVKELSLSEDLPDSAHTPNEMQSQTSSSSFYDAVRGEMTPKVIQTESHERLMDTEPSKGIAIPASKVQDIFEVPKTPLVGAYPNSPLIKEAGKLSLEAEINPWKPDAAKLAIPGFMDKSNWDRKTPMSPSLDNNHNMIPKPRDGLGVEQLYFKRPDVHDLEFQQMNRRLKRLEDERIMFRPETPRPEISIEKEDEHMNILKAIQNQLNSIEEEIMSWRHKKSTPEEELDLTFLAEEFMHFW